MIDAVVTKTSQLAKEANESKRQLWTVHKYRQKKKAHTEHLEEEVKKLRVNVINKQLVKMLQGQGTDEVELAWLRTSMVDVQGKIDSALGNYPFQTQRDAGNSWSCDVVAQCLQAKGVIGSWGSAFMNCDISAGSDQNPYWALALLL